MTLFHVPSFHLDAPCVSVFRIPLLLPCLFAGIQFALPPGASAQAAPATPVKHRPAAMQRAAGPFDVTTTPAGAPDVQDGSTLGRLAIDKRYHGELSGSGKGEMLTAIGARPGSAAYVAVERVSGTLHGRQGSFAVHHTGTRSGGVDHLAIAIVPDSGSGQLAGISGTMDIQVVDGKHFYVLEYRLP